MARKSLSDQLKGLLAYRNRPERKKSPVQTNWTTTPANDNASTDEVRDLAVERSWRMTPSVNEIMREVDKDELEKNDDGQTVRIGRLRFSDGTQTERANMIGPDGKVMQFDARMPVGAMLRTRDNPESPLGGASKPASIRKSNSYFAEVLCTLPFRYKPGSVRRNGHSYTAAESQRILDDAIANTPVMPAVKHYPPGLPCGSASVSESFLGMKKGKKGESGSIAWEDISQAMAHSEVWEKTLAELRSETKRTAESAMTARTYTDVGMSLGMTKEYARRKGGRRALLAANDDIAAAIRKYSA